MKDVKAKSTLQHTPNARNINKTQGEWNTRHYFVQTDASILLAYNIALHARRMTTPDHTATKA